MKPSFRLVVTVILVIASLYLFGLITHEVLFEKEETADQIVSKTVRHYFVSNDATKAMIVASYLASKQFLMIAFAAVALWCIFIKKDRRLALESIAIGITGFLINTALKEMFQRVRPADPLIDPLRNFSYPSGHASSGIIFYGLLVHLVWRSDISKPLKLLFSLLMITLVLLIGFSRIYLGMHYASDVVAGYCVGFTWLIISLWVIDQLRRKHPL